MTTEPMESEIPLPHIPDDATPAQALMAALGYLRQTVTHDVDAAVRAALPRVPASPDTNRVSGGGSGQASELTDSRSRRMIYGAPRIPPPLPWSGDNAKEAHASAWWNTLENYARLYDHDMIDALPNFFTGKASNWYTQLCIIQHAMAMERQIVGASNISDELSVAQIEKNELSAAQMQRQKSQQWQSRDRNGNGKRPAFPPPPHANMKREKQTHLSWVTAKGWTGPNNRPHTQETIDKATANDLCFRIRAHCQVRLSRVHPCQDPHRRVRPPDLGSDDTAALLGRSWMKQAGCMVGYEGPRLRACMHTLKRGTVSIDSDRIPSVPHSSLELVTYCLARVADASTTPGLLSIKKLRKLLRRTRDLNAFEVTVRSLDEDDDRLIEILEAARADLHTASRNGRANTGTLSPRTSGPQ
eukprot:gene19306-25954_t